MLDVRKQPLSAYEKRFICSHFWVTLCNCSQRKGGLAGVSPNREGAWMAFHPAPDRGWPHRPCLPDPRQICLGSLLVSVCLAEAEVIAHKQVREMKGQPLMHEKGKRPSEKLLENP